MHLRIDLSPHWFGLGNKHREIFGSLTHMPWDKRRLMKCWNLILLTVTRPGVQCEDEVFHMCLQVADIAKVFQISVTVSNCHKMSLPTMMPRTKVIGVFPGSKFWQVFIFQLVGGVQSELVEQVQRLRIWPTTIMMLFCSLTLSVLFHYTSPSDCVIILEYDLLPNFSTSKCYIFHV